MAGLLISEVLLDTTVYLWGASYIPGERCHH